MSGECFELGANKVKIPRKIRDSKKHYDHKPRHFVNFYSPPNLFLFLYPGDDFNDFTLIDLMGSEFPLVGGVPIFSTSGKKVIDFFSTCNGPENQVIIKIYRFESGSLQLEYFFDPPNPKWYFSSPTWTNDDYITFKKLLPDGKILGDGKLLFDSLERKWMIE